MRDYRRLGRVIFNGLTKPKGSVACSRLMATLKTTLGNCLPRGRRQCVEVAMNSPHKCLYVLLILKNAYTNDALTKKQGCLPNNGSTSTRRTADR